METVTLTIENTSSEKILKFKANTMLISGSYEFNNIDEAKNSPLAQELFYLPFVKRVFISANFVAVEKFDIVEWEDIKEDVKNKIEHYLNNPGVIVHEEEISKKKVPIEIYAESTPNPSTLKFVANKALVANDFEYKNIEEAVHSPLATALFNFPFVKEVYISENYITIKKFDIVEWEEITQKVRAFIKDFIADGKSVVNSNAPSNNEANDHNISFEDVTLDETSKKIIELLDEYVKPAVAADGGNIAFQSYDENSKIVNVILQGSCSGCPSSTVTLKNGIESMLKQLIPGKIEQVVAINQ